MASTALEAGGLSSSGARLRYRAVCWTRAACRAYLVCDWEPFRGAPWRNTFSLNYPVSRAAFDIFAAQVLAPSLIPGQTVIWDNLSVHKSATAQRLIEAAGGQVRFLPPYSPDFAPIEQAFSKLKTVLRRTQARTWAALDAAITAGLATITATDARAWFGHCGYDLSRQSV